MLSTPLLLVTFGLSVFASVLGVVAAIYARRRILFHEQFRSMLLAMQELDDNHAALLASHQKLRSRVGMREMRAKRKDANGADELDVPLPKAESPEEWKKRMRVELHKGTLKP